MTEIIPLILSLAKTGADLYLQMHDHVENNNIAAAVAIIPTAAAVYNSYNDAVATLSKAQAEAWTENDSRWNQVFVNADAALKNAQARL